MTAIQEQLSPTADKRWCKVSITPGTVYFAHSHIIQAPIGWHAPTLASIANSGVLCSSLSCLCCRTIDRPTGIVANVTPIIATPHNLPISPSSNNRPMGSGKSMEQGAIHTANGLLQWSLLLKVVAHAQKMLSKSCVLTSPHSRLKGYFT